MKLTDDFFAVCQTAIKAAAWKYEDFNRVKAVEGELERLRQSNMAEPMETTTLEILENSGQVSTTMPQVVKDTFLETTPRLGTPTVLKPHDNKILSPDQVKEAPVRPMPDDILELVQAGVEVAKNPPPVREVKVEELPNDPDAARQAFNKPF